MKAIQLLQFTSDISQLKLADVEKPKPGPGQVLVKMRYSAINPSDFNFIRGDYQTTWAEHERRIAVQREAIDLESEAGE